MADTGATSPTTGANNSSTGITAWTDPGDILSSNNVYATAAGTIYANSKTHYLKATNFGFAIPTGSTINGIVVAIERKASLKETYVNFVVDNRVRIIKSNGSIGTTDKADTSTLWTTTDAYKTYGSSGDLWGETWTAEDINDSDFGVTISANITAYSDNVTAYVDHIRITVYYTATAAPTVTTQAVTNISSATATGNGNVTSEGTASVTARGVCWNTGGSPTTADSTATSSGTTGAYTPAITGLAGATTYYVKAYATNSVGTSYGDQVQFTTLGWTTPNNAFSSNDSYATVASTDGDVSVQLSGDAGATYSSNITKTYTSSEILQTYGNGSTELWGLTWLGSNVSDTNFRLKITAGGVTQVYKTFGFAPGASVVLTGIEVSVEAKWDGATTSVDHIKVKIYYGTSITPVQAGSMAYDTTTSKLATYNGSSWDEYSTSTSVIQTIYPVGSIYISTLSTNPATLLGFGTWAVFGAGRTLVSLDSGDTDFDAAEETRGAKTVDIFHTHTGPSHTHVLSAAGWAHVALGTTAGEEIGMLRQTVTGWTTTHTNDSGSTSAASNSRTTGTTLGGATDAGGTGATGSSLSATQSIVQPSIVVYIWKRTA